MQPTAQAVGGKGAKEISLFGTKLINCFPSNFPLALSLIHLL